MEKMEQKAAQADGEGGETETEILGRGKSVDEERIVETFALRR